MSVIVFSAGRFTRGKHHQREERKHSRLTYSFRDNFFAIILGEKREDFIWYSAGIAV